MPLAWLFHRAGPSPSASVCEGKPVFPVSERNKLPGALRAAGCVRAQFRIDETARVLPADPELPAKETAETPVSRVARAEGEGACRCFGSRKKRAPERSLLKWLDSYYSMISVTTPEPTVLPPSRIAKRRPSSIAIGVISSTVITTLSPGMHISVPSGRDRSPVTSVVLK